MAIHPIEYRYGTPEMKSIWETENKLQRKLDVESALAQAEGKLGIIPQEVADEIAAKANTKYVKLERVDEIEAQTKHDIAALVKAIGEVCDNDAGEYVHFGATSNDVVDSSNSLLLNDSIEVLKEKVERLTKIMLDLTKENIDKACIGRTHGQHALPTTYGMKFGIWADELHRQYERLENAQKNVCVAMMDGAVGTTAALGEDGWKIHKEVANILGLPAATITNQVVQRDNHVEFISTLANIASTLDKIALESEKLDRLKNSYDESKQKINTAKVYLKKAKKTKIRDKKVIFYCICGEGMGHAIRSSVIIDRIKDKYDVYIFSSDRAYKYLNEKFDNVYKIGGFNTVYINNKVSNTKTLMNAIKRNPLNIKEGYEELYKKARKLSPDIIVTDFEIYATMVSKLLSIPLISLDNIHMITQTAIDYPPKHQGEMLKAKGVIKSYVIKPKIHILTSFFYPKIKPKKRAVLYPPVIREDILKLEPTIENHIIVYQTSKESVKLVEQLKSLNEKFIVYGFNKDKTDENLTYKLFNEDEFYNDLASAKAVICNGGFTFISEAISLKKPIYSVPAIGNFEQTLNGFYVQKLGYGEYHEKMSPQKVEKFLKRLSKYQKKLAKVKKTNNDGIVNELIYRIEKYSKKS